MNTDQISKNIFTYNKAIVIKKHGTRHSVMIMHPWWPNRYIAKQIKKNISKINLKIPEKVYRKVYCTGLARWNLYENPKIQKLLPNDVKELSSRPIHLQSTYHVETELLQDIWLFGTSLYFFLIQFVKWKYSNVANREICYKSFLSTC